MSVFRLVQKVFLAVIVVASLGYFLWVEIPQFLFFQSTQAHLESIEQLCFLSKEGQASASDCPTVQARAGKKRVYRIYRATLRYQSPADDREHVETILTRALGRVSPGATWKVLAHTSEPNRVQPANDAGRSILFGVSVLLFVAWFRGVVYRFVRRSVQGAQHSSSGGGGILAARNWLLGAVALGFLFFIFARTIRP